MYRCVGVLGGEKDSSVVSVSPILTIHVWLVLIDMIREREVFGRKPRTKIPTVIRIA